MRATEHGHCKRTSIYRYLFRCLGLKNIFINYYDSKKVDYGFCYDSVHVTATAGTEYMEKHTERCSPGHITGAGGQNVKEGAQQPVSPVGGYAELSEVLSPGRSLRRTRRLCQCCGKLLRCIQHSIRIERQSSENRVE